MTPLQTAVQAVITEWEEHAWASDACMEYLRKALGAEQAQATEALKATPEDMLIYRNIAKQAVPHATETLSDFDMRGVLASNLLCWHRMTEAEAQDLICFFEQVRAQQVAPYDQQAMELCPECGWKAIMPGEPCFVCNMQASAQQVAVPPGYALAMAVLQSSLYQFLDDVERAECDALIAAGQSPKGAKP